MEVKHDQIRIIHDWDYQPELCQINKTSSNSSGSCDHTDLLSFEDSTFVSDLSSSRPPSATSFLDDECTKVSAQSSSVAPSSNRGQRSKGSHNSVYVMVSGASFAVPFDAFNKISKLPWRSDHQGLLHLDASPAVFEILLSYIVFETLPAYDTLSRPEYEEFEPMALCLGFNDLVEHFGRSSDKRLRSRKGRRRSSILKKKHQGNHIVLNSENVNTTTTKMMAANGKAARFIASLTRQGRTDLKNRKIKATHDQLCASDHVN